MTSTNDNKIEGRSVTMEPDYSTLIQKKGKEKVTLMLPNRFVRSVLTPPEGIRYLSTTSVYELLQTQLRKSAVRTVSGGICGFSINLHTHAFHCKNAAKLPWNELFNDSGNSFVRKSISKMYNYFPLQYIHTL